MVFHIQLTTQDNQQISFDCGPDQDLLTAASDAGMTLPSQCRRGSCGACHASVSRGDYRLGEHNPNALAAREPNGILMCRTTPRSDLQIALPYDKTKILSHPAPRRIAEIVAVEPIADNTVRLELRLDPNEGGGCAAEFEPGQFMELQIPDTEECRPFSLANTSNWDGRLEFLIRLQPDGRFSGWLNERACPGAKLVVRGPEGGFGIRQDSLRARWLVAGGTGLAPMLSILRRMAEFQEIQDVRLFFGVNREKELFALNELEQLAAGLPQLKVDICVWKPEGTWQGFTGTPVDALRQALEQEQVKPDLYVCGPPRLVSACEVAAAEFNLPSEQIFSEKFLGAST